jgi:hypothetical protein
VNAETNPIARELLELVDLLVAKASAPFDELWGHFEPWHESYMKAYFGSRRGGLPWTQYDFFSDVYEQACKVSSVEWTDPESSGEIGVRDFARWLRDKRSQYVATHP